MRQQAEQEARELRERQVIFQAAFEEQLRAFKVTKSGGGTSMSLMPPAPKASIAEEYQEGDEESNQEAEEEKAKKLDDIALEIAPEEVNALELFLEDDEDDEDVNDPNRKSPFGTLKFI